MQQIVTHKGTQYSVRKLADGQTWRLSEVGCPRNSFPMSRKHMILAGFGHIVRQSDPNGTYEVRAAQSKAAIAEYLGNESMWNQAADQLRQSTGRSLH